MRNIEINTVHIAVFFLHYYFFKGRWVFICRPHAERQPRTEHLLAVLFINFFFIYNLPFF